MSGGQIAALVFGVLLLIPGGCFTVFGIGSFRHQITRFVADLDDGAGHRHGTD